MTVCFEVAATLLVCSTYDRINSALHDRCVVQLHLSVVDLTLQRLGIYPPEVHVAHELARNWCRMTVYTSVLSASLLTYLVQCQEI